ALQSNKTSYVSLPLPDPRAGLFGGPASLLQGVAELLGDDPLVGAPGLEQADDGGLAPVQRHHVLEQDPEDEQVDRPGRADGVEDGDSRRHIHRHELGQPHVRHQHARRDHDAVEEEDIGGFVTGVSNKLAAGMVTRADYQEDDEKNISRFTNGTTSKSSWGTPAPSGGHSTSSSESQGSPSTQNEAAAMTPGSENTFLRLNHLDIIGDDAGSPQWTISDKKKKRGVRQANGDKNGRGLRIFSKRVCEKVESKGKTTYNEVADELVAEFADPSSNLVSFDKQQYDDKNIRRRVYDAINVLVAMDIISRDKKEIEWKGLPCTSQSDIEELKAERRIRRSRIEKKAGYLQELEEQYTGLQNLVERNEQQFNAGIAPSGGVALPFILVQTRPHATVEVEISEDMQLVHFDFNSIPFELHDDTYVLKAMRFSERRNRQ
ncbi:hypothetical protein Taro_024028, partial [Colocasia esculenta]|nr:hypothetical protein [Colocasia esculenta]